MALNLQNLVPNEQRTPEQRRKNASKAGKASAAARRKRKAIKECMEILLSSDVANPKDYNALAAAGLDEKNISNPMLVALGLFDKAKDGDVQAVKLLLELIGETKDQGGGNVVINIVDDLK